MQNQKKIIVATGFRRCGKTCLLLRLISTLLIENRKEEVFYINFEDERISRDTKFLSDLMILSGVSRLDLNKGSEFFMRCE